MGIDQFRYIKEIKEYAKEHKVPIMQDDGINFLTNFIIKHQITSVLEVGTAIGYSAIQMVLTSPTVKVTSIERDHERYLQALKNIKQLNLEDRITLIFRDAKEVHLDEKFDLIFLDAAKAQNIAFFEQFEKNLNPRGFILTDNISFHGLVEQEESKIESRNVRGLVRKIKNYIQFLKENEHYEVTCYKVGDGIAVARQKEE